MDINGVVKVKENHKPIPYASIYINNSSIGTSSDVDGKFKLTNLQQQSVELVVTAIGYQSLSMNVQLPLKEPLQILLELKAKEIEEIVVMGYVKDGWKKWGLFFTESLIGVGYNAEQTKIENSEVVKFRYDKEGKILTAFCEEPLIIHNKKLGYRITYDLTAFSYDFKMNALYFEGYAFFDDLGKGKKAFQRARKATYDVSLMKFIRSTYHKKWKQDGYIVRKLVKKDNQTRIEALAKHKEITSLVNEKYQKNWKLFYVSQKEISADYVQSLVKQSNQPPQISYLMGEMNPQDIIVNEDELKQLKELSFSDYLYVIYPAVFENAKDKMLQDASSQVSEVQLLSEERVLVDASGNFFPASNLFFHGFMVNFSKLAFVLPLDYIDEKE